MLPLPAAGAGATGDTAMSSTQHQLIEQCATRLRGIVEALDNIHDNTPHRWSTDLDDVHSSAESLLALINDQAPARSEASFEEWLANELEGEDGQPVPAAACDITLARRAFNHWPKLEQPAKVGGVRFSAGVSSRLVVEAAQRLYEFESTPEKEAERIDPEQESVEQAGGDERAACNLWIAEQQLCQGSDISLFKLERNGALVSLHELLRDAYQAGQARAALAQPSPKCATCNDSGQIVVSGPHYQGEFQPPEYETEPCDMCAQPSPAQAEAERLREAYEWGYGDGQNNPNGYSDKKERDACVNELLKQPSTVQADAERPTYECTMGVGGGDGNLFVHGDHASIKAAQKIVLERDAALARVAELELGIARIAGDFLPDNSGQAELALDEMRQALHELLVAAPTQAQHSVPEKVRTLLSRAQCEIEHLAECLENVCEDEEDFDVREDVADGRVVAADIAHMLAAAPDKEVPQAWLDVQAERRRQVEAEGWTPEHDDEHSHGQMARAAACYALAGSSAPNDGTAALLVSLAWPWDQQWWKPTSARRDLVKACALALAEIERLDRAGISQSPQPGATTASS